MIILSQDKKALVNFNNITRIYVCVNSIICNLIDTYNEGILAKYDTEERAKEVLQEIVNCYSKGTSFNKIGDNEYQNYGNVYEMPQD